MPAPRLRALLLLSLLPLGCPRCESSDHPSETEGIALDGGSSGGDRGTIGEGEAEAEGDDGRDACGGAPLTVTFYDAGQALAALVTLPDARRILVDAGEDPGRAGCGAAVCGAWNQRVVDGVMADLGGDGIDLLWITHQHSDHHGGLPRLAEQTTLSVAHYVDNGTKLDSKGVERARTAARSRGAQIHEVFPGQTTIPIPDGDEVTLQAMVAPQWPVSNCNGTKQNECSIGLQITYCDSTILFMGDAEQKAEAKWPVGDVDLLQVGHHGSDTSSEQPFLHKVSPEYAVISAGKRGEGTNRTYCHPIRETVDRLTAATGGPGSRQIEVFDASERTCKGQRDEDWKTVSISDRLWITALDGTVTLVTTGDGEFHRSDREQPR